MTFEISEKTKSAGTWRFIDFRFAVVKFLKETQDRRIEDVGQKQTDKHDKEEKFDFVQIPTCQRTGVPIQILQKQELRQVYSKQNDQRADEIQSVHD